MPLSDNDPFDGKLNGIGPPMWFSFCCAADEIWKFKREKKHLVNNLNEWILMLCLIWWLLNLSSLCHTVYKCHLIYLPIRFNLKICLSLTWLLFVQRDLKTQNGMCDYLLLTQLNNKNSNKKLGLICKNISQFHLYAFSSACKFSWDYLCASIALNLVNNRIYVLLL